VRLQTILREVLMVTIYAIHVCVSQICFNSYIIIVVLPIIQKEIVLQFVLQCKIKAESIGSKLFHSMALFFHSKQS
jgi:hypothetical protein